jgi:hypothetical protein
MKAILIVVVLFFCSCEKTIDIKLDAQDDILVVEATIENDAPPVVTLTRSLNYFGQLNPSMLNNLFVRNAQVFISNGQTTHQLKEYTVERGPGFRLYYYGIDSNNLATAFKGSLNTSYELKIISEGREYTARTTIPPIRKSIDSLWWKKGTYTDTAKVEVLVRLTDAPGNGDYLRYFTKRNNSPFLPAENSVYDDLFIDGKSYEVPVDPGIDRNNRLTSEENAFRRGDTVVFKLSMINKTTYDFWRTMEYSYQAIGNPFAAPINVAGNISNGALGYFGGYASQYRTLIIPR